MDKIIIIDDNGIQQEVQKFITNNKNHIRLSSDMDELSLAGNPLVKEIINQYEARHKVKICSGDKIRFYYFNHIVRLEKKAEKTKIYLSDGSHSLLNEEIKNIEIQLRNFPFLRVHPKHIVNLHFLAKISRLPTSHIELSTGKLIPITESSKKAIIDFLNKYDK